MSHGGVVSSDGALGSPPWSKTCVLDFSGWATSFDWQGIVSGRVPGWLLAGASLLGAAGGVLLVSSWTSLGVGVGAWLALAGLALAGLVIDGTTVGSMELRPVVLGHAHSLGLAGGAAYLASRSGDSTLAQVIACVAVASAPLLTRIWCATLFSREMVGRAEELGRLAAEALRGSSAVVLLEVKNERDDGFELSICRTDGDLPARAPKSLLAARRYVRPGHHYLLEQPDISEPAPEPIGYRDARRVAWVEAGARLWWFSFDRLGTPASAFAEEVRAGVVVVAAHHALVAAVAWALARALL